MASNRPNAKRAAARIPTSPVTRSQRLQIHISPVCSISFPQKAKIA